MMKRDFMSKELNLKEKIERLIEVYQQKIRIENRMSNEIDNLYDEYLAKYEDFDQEAEFPSLQSYIKIRCGVDPATKKTKKYFANLSKPKISVGIILGIIVMLFGGILTIIDFINNSMAVPIWQVVVCIIGFLVFITSKSKYDANVEEYNKNVQLYNVEKAKNAKLSIEHNEWNLKVKAVTQQYEQEREEFINNYNICKQAYERDENLYNEAKAKLIDKHENNEEYNSVLEEYERLQSEIIDKLSDADKKIPKSKKYNFDLFEPSYDEVFGDTKLTFNFFKVDFAGELLPEINLYLVDEDMVTALLTYYKERHVEDLEQQRLRFEEERNEIERERIRSYERQEKEKRKQLEEIEKQNRIRESEQQEEMKKQAIIARCSRCRKYNSCASWKRNNKENCLDFEN